MTSVPLTPRIADLPSARGRISHTTFEDMVGVRLGTYEVVGYMPKMVDKMSVSFF